VILWFIFWAGTSLELLFKNLDLIYGLSAWRSAALTVTLIIFAPVFFIYDLAVLLLDIIVGEEYEEEDCD
jgi:hypothetical protein